MPSDDLRILHWNIHSWRDPSGHANVAAVADLIGQTAPDIVSLAEVDEAWGAPGSLRDLAGRCGYSWVFVPALESGRDRPDGGFGNALLTRLPILAVQQWQLLWPPRRYDGSEPSEARSVLLARVQQTQAPVLGRDHSPAAPGRPRPHRCAAAPRDAHRRPDRAVAHLR